MRCRACDSSNTRYVLGDWYCPECSSSIHQTIKEDKTRDVMQEDWFSRDIKEIGDEDDREEEK